MGLLVVNYFQGNPGHREIILIINALMTAIGRFEGSYHPKVKDLIINDLNMCLSYMFLLLIVSLHCIVSFSLFLWLFTKEKSNLISIEKKY